MRHIEAVLFDLFAGQTLKATASKCLTFLKALTRFRCHCKLSAAVSYCASIFTLFHQVKLYVDQVTSEPTEQESWKSAKTGAVWPCSQCHLAVEKSPDMFGSSFKKFQESLRNSRLLSFSLKNLQTHCSFPRRKEHKSS